MIIVNVFGGSDLLLEVCELVSGVRLLDVRGDGNSAVNEHGNLLEILLHEAAAESEFEVSGFLGLVCRDGLLFKEAAAEPYIEQPRRHENAKKK